MARKESITREIIVKGAYNFVREFGYSNLTARKLAAYVGCSTQPIFRIFANMEELNNEIYEMAKKSYEEYYSEFPKKNSVPFVDLSIAYITFAKEEPNLFRMLFMDKSVEKTTMYDIINVKEKGYVIRELKKIPSLDMNNAEMIFMKVFVFMHGLGCMTISGELDLDENEISKLLNTVVKSFLV